MPRDALLHLDYVERFHNNNMESSPMHSPYEPSISSPTVSKQSKHCLTFMLENSCITPIVAHIVLLPK